jgi:IclR family acetate operon transcriptional repressor
MVRDDEISLKDDRLASSRAGGVQSVQRAFQILETMADHGGMIGLSRLASESGLPLPTIHRLIRTLVELGYVRQEPSRQYVLGPRLLMLGESSERMLGVIARPYLAQLVEDVGESANLAMHDGDKAVYVAQVPSRHAMRMFTEVGRRVMLHCSAVGKVILAGLPTDQAVAILERAGMPARTDNTITDIDILMEQLSVVRERGYAMDEGEREVGVRCVGVAVEGNPQRLAVSISGPTERVSDGLVERAVPFLMATGERLAKELV